MEDSTLVKVANLASMLEADLAVSLLQSAGIFAIARGNDSIAVWGPGYIGGWSRGVDVLVRADQAQEAREVLDEAETDPTR